MEPFAGYGYFKLFDLPPHLADEISAVGAHLEHSPSQGLMLVFPDGAIKSYPVKSTAIALAKAGSLGAVSKAAIAKNLTDFFTLALENYSPVSGDVSSIKKQFLNSPSISKWIKDSDNDFDDTPTMVDLEVDDAKGPDPGHPESNPSMSPFKKPMGKTSSKTPASDQILEHTMSAAMSSVISLSLANSVGQKVHGTSKNSVYYVVARFDGLAVAMRAKSGRLSMRVEGPKLLVYTTQLMEVGFSMKSGYASVHYDAGTPELVSKTVGAVLATLGLSSLVEVEDATKFMGL